jgi:hypothetical protein
VLVAGRRQRIPPDVGPIGQFVAPVDITFQRRDGDVDEFEVIPLLDILARGGQPSCTGTSTSRRWRSC